MSAKELKELEKMIDTLTKDLEEEDYKLNSGMGMILAHRDGLQIAKGLLRLVYKKQPVTLNSIRAELFYE